MDANHFVRGYDSTTATSTFALPLKFGYSDLEPATNTINFNESNVLFDSLGNIHTLYVHQRLEVSSDLSIADGHSAKCGNVHFKNSTYTQHAYAHNDFTYALKIVSPYPIGIRPSTGTSEAPLVLNFTLI